MYKTLLLFTFVMASAMSEETDFSGIIGQRIIRESADCINSRETMELGEHDFMLLTTPHFPDEGHRKPFTCRYRFEAPEGSNLHMECTYINVDRPDLMLIIDGENTTRIRGEEIDYHHSFSNNAGEVVFRKRDPSADSSGFTCLAWVEPAPEEEQCHCGYLPHGEEHKRIESPGLPWSAILKRDDNEGPICSGTLISDRNVAVSLICLRHFEQRIMANSSWEIHFIGNPNRILTRPVLEVIIPEDGPHHARIGRNALAILRTRPLNWNRYPHIRPICLPSSTLETFAGSVGYTLGWPRSHFDEIDLEEPAMMIRAPEEDFHNIAFIFNQAQCAEFFGVDHLPKQFMCGFAHVQENQCLGHGGEALAVRNGHYLEFAGMLGEEHCFSHHPVKMQRMSAFVHWIHEVAKGADFCERY